MIGLDRTLIATRRRRSRRPVCPSLVQWIMLAFLVGLIAFNLLR